jgi:hypothetical protein
MDTNKKCGAKTRSGAPCKNSPVVGRTRCKMHGGMSARAGPTHHAWKHGRRSKVLDARYSGALDGLTIQDAYHLARTDPKLLQLTEEIAVLVAKQQQTLEGLRTGESGPAWEALAVLVDKALAVADNPTELALVLDQMADVVANGVGDAAIWAEYTERAERIRRLVDTQRKYEEGLRMYLPLDQAEAIFALWQDAIRRAVPKEYIARIHEELQKSRAGKTAANLH